MTADPDGVRAFRVVPVADVRVLRPRADLGDLDGLARSIGAVGLLHPPILSPDLALLAGRRRLAAVQRLGWEHLVVQLSEADPLQVEHDENEFRLPLTPSERVRLAEELRVAAAARAADRRRAGLLRGQPDKSKSGAESDSSVLPEGSRTFSVWDDSSHTDDTQPDQSPPKRARAEVAAQVGNGEQYLRRAAEVVAAAEADPKRYGDLVAWMDRSGKVNGAWTELRRRRQAEAVERRAVEAPAGVYDVIVCDPPWRYDEKLDDRGLRGGLPYATLSVEQIIAVPPPAGRDAILWLWTTNAMLLGGQAHAVLAGWEFTPKALLTWDKEHLGAGHWLRNVTEHAILAVKGHPVVRLTTQTTLLRARRGGHSEKPDAFYALVERLCPGRRLEMYARRRREGWDAHGLEVSP